MLVFATLWYFQCLAWCNWVKKLLDHQSKIDSDSPSTTNCSTVVLKDLKHSFSDLGHNFLAFASYSKKTKGGPPAEWGCWKWGSQTRKRRPFSILLRACAIYVLFLISFRTVLCVIPNKLSPRTISVELTSQGGSELEKHIFKVHEKKKSFECKMWKTSFSLKKTTNQIHQISSWKSRTIFKCEICEFVKVIFKSKTLKRISNQFMKHLDLF